MKKSLRFRSKAAWRASGVALFAAAMLLAAHVPRDAARADQPPDRSLAQAPTAPAPDSASENTAGKPQPITLPLSGQLTRLFTSVPKDADDLRAMERHMQQLAKRLKLCTVAVRLNGGMGSGVIISPDGYVLTAGHVTGRSDRNVTIVLHDGHELPGKTRGANYAIDSGLIKLNGEGPWPYAELGSSSDLKRGQWVFGTGHPGGFDRQRDPPVRLARVLESEPSVIITDCTLVGGDSGGPLFDMEGRVIGIHSRIGDELKANLHVPIDTYKKTWDRLVKGDTWGGLRPGGPVIGVVSERDAKQAKVARVVPDSPAEEAGIQVGDVITRFDGKPVETFIELSDAVSEKEPGDEVEIELRRGDKTISLQLIVGSLGL